MSRKASITQHKLSKRGFMSKIVSAYPAGRQKTL
jgi:hypothetical protein